MQPRKGTSLLYKGHFSSLKKTSLLERALVINFAGGGGGGHLPLKRPRPTSLIINEY